MNPESMTVHQLGQHRGTPAGTLAYSEDVNIFTHDSFAETIEVEVRRDDVIVVEQEHVPGFHRVDGEVASNSDTHIGLVGVDDLAV